MFAILHSLGMFVADLLKSRRRLEAENLFLRHQLNIALRQAPPRRVRWCSAADTWFCRCCRPRSFRRAGSTTTPFSPVMARRKPCHGPSSPLGLRTNTPRPDQRFVSPQTASSPRRLAHSTDLTVEAVEISSVLARALKRFGSGRPGGGMIIP